MDRSRLRIGDRVEIRGPHDVFPAVLLEDLGDEWRVAPDAPWQRHHSVGVDRILRKLPTTLERDTGPTVYYRQRDADGKSAGSLHHRQVQALIAVRAGLGQARLRRHQSPWFCDYHLEPEIGVYGIGRGTVGELVRWGYIAERQDEGPLALTAKGDRILDEILALDGVTLPPMVTELAA